MESLNRNNPEGLVNSSDTLLAPSIDLGFPTNNPQNSSMNSPFPALIDNSVPQLHKLFPNVDENTPTITEATTLADSKHLASQTESQIGNLNIDENHSPDHTSKEVINEKNGIRPFVNSSTSIEETKTISETGNSKEETQNEEEINGGENSQSETKSNKDESELNKASNIDTITQTDNQEKKEVMEDKGINESIPEKEQSLRKISVGDNKSSEISENGNRGLESSAQKQQIPLLTLGRGDSANKSEPSDKQFISDQHDSEGYNNSNRKTRESLKDISAPSSGTEEGKEKEVLKNQPIKKPKISLADFQKITLLGRGSYAEVHLVKRVQNQNKIYALKVIDKYFMKKEKKEHQVYVEKEVLMKSNHPNIIKFYSSFQDKKKLYFVLEYVGGGEFSNYLSIQRTLSRDQIIFFTAEIINILEYLHSNGIAHRDLKPENLLLTNDGHLKCIDFGTARFLDKRTSDLLPAKKQEEIDEEHANDETRQRTDSRTFVGTAQYVSPEMLENSECSAPGDLWALGCMVYQMATGRYPFEGATEYIIFEKIKNFDITFPDDMDVDIKDLVQKLIVMDPQKRLGAGPPGSENDYAALKAHPLFNGVNFALLHKQKAPLVDIVSPYKQKSQPYATFEELAQRHMPTRKHFLSDDLQNLEKEHTEPKQIKVEAEKISVETQVTEDNQEIMSGLVSKKCGWLFFRTRLLVLNNKPSLSYFDPDTKQFKGDIPLDEATSAKLESKTSWMINTPKRKYYFKEIEPESCEKWVKEINMMVEKIRQSNQDK